jgi:hypothetical protein
VRGGRVGVAAAAEAADASEGAQQARGRLGPGDRPIALEKQVADPAGGHGEDRHGEEQEDAALVHRGRERGERQELGRQVQRPIPRIPVVREVAREEF